MKMEKPTVEAVRFQSSDVIATSGGVTLSYFNDDVSTNNIFTVGGIDYGPGAPGTTIGDLVTALKGAGGEGDSADSVWFVSGDNPIALEYSNDPWPGLWDWKSGSSPDFNGTYTWYNDGSFGPAWYKN